MKSEVFNGDCWQNSVTEFEGSTLVCCNKIVSAATKILFKKKKFFSFFYEELLKAEILAQLKIFQVRNEEALSVKFSKSIVHVL